MGGHHLDPSFDEVKVRGGVVGGGGEAMAGEPDRLGGGERYDTDRFFPRVDGGRRVGSPKMGGRARGVAGL